MGKEIRYRNRATENSYEANLSVWSDEMERESVLKDLSHQIENLSRLQPQYRLHRTGDFDKLRLSLSRTSTISTAAILTDLPGKAPALCRAGALPSEKPFFNRILYRLGTCHPTVLLL